MIKVNGIEIKTGNFPDGSLMMLNVPSGNTNSITIEWHYESDVEVVKLIYLVNHYRQLYGKNLLTINLIMPYIPNARMDRVKGSNEVFTLKWFANIINGLDFENVYVFDPHSDVSLALIDRIHVIDVSEYIGRAMAYIRGYADRNSNFVIYFPDAGAYKRYKDISNFKGMTKIYGQKIRDWKTGQILGLQIVDENGNSIEHNFPAGTKVIMIDDIISYGGTFYYSVLELKKHNPSKIYAYASHVEPKSLWDEEKGKFGKLLKDGIVEKLYTTNSIYYNSYNDDKYVTVFNLDK